MKKTFSAIMAALLALSLTACGNSNEKTSGSDNSSSSSTGKPDNSSSSKPESKPDSPQTAEHSPKEIEAAIAKALGDGYLCTADVPDEEIPLSCIGWLDLTKIDEYVVKQPTVYAQDAVGIVKCKAGYADEAAKILNDHFAQSISYIRQYPFDVAKVEGTRIYRYGDTLMYITAGAAATAEMSEEDAAKLADSEYKKIDKAMEDLFGKKLENLAVMPEETENSGGSFELPDDPDFGGDSVPVIGG